MNRVVVIPTPQTVVDRINEMGVSEEQPEGIQFTNRDDRVTINDLDFNLDNNSNASDKRFVHNNEYEKEFKKEGQDEDLATNKTQEDHFQLPF